jgi:hypothetical protein
LMQKWPTADSCTLVNPIKRIFWKNWVFNLLCSNLIAIQLP